jgi:hypothetical protein
MDVFYKEQVPHVETKFFHPSGLPSVCDVISANFREIFYKIFRPRLSSAEIGFMRVVQYLGV